MSKQALGRGLGALIPSQKESDAEDLRYRMVSINEIRPNPMQPRRDFDLEKLHELAASLKTDGMMQPLVLKKNGSGYAIIAGERRYRAAKLAGFDQVPAMIMDSIDDSRMLELALIENIQREDLNPLETAEAFKRLIDTCGLTQQDLADRIGKSRAAVANQLRLLTLPASIAQFVREGKLSEGHARSLLALSSEDEMVNVARQVIDGNWSVREVEKDVAKRKPRRLIPRRKLPALADAESWLKQLLGTSVKIIPGLKRGRIEVEYYSDEDLGRLLELFRKIV